MASHPYISGPGNITQMIGFLRKSFPATVTSETVKKFGLAPNNESYVINALQFIGIIDEEGKRTEKGHDVFVLGDDQFPSEFGKMVEGAYSDLFDLRGDDAWKLSKSELTTYFRTSDKTSEVIGGRQASVFLAFSALSGHAPVSESSGTKSPPKPKKSPVKASAPKSKSSNKSTIEVNKDNLAPGDSKRDMALTVRIEINLPANGSKETYDNIFKSIRANLIDE